MDLARLGQVGDAGVRAHEDVGRVQRALEEAAPRLRQVDAAERRLGQRVGRHQRQTVDAHLAQSRWFISILANYHSDSEIRCGLVSFTSSIRTWWIESTACSTRDIHWKLCSDKTNKQKLGEI